MGASSAGQRDDRLQTAVARVIVVVSILGAVVSWQASERSQDAGGYDQQAAQDRILAEQHRAESRSTVAQDVRLLGPAQRAYREQALLERDARRAQRNGDRGRAEDLRLEARRSGLEGDTVVNLMAVGWDLTELNPDGSVSVDPRGVVQARDANNDELQGLRPVESRRLGDEAHDKSVKLVLAATTLVAALFFLTLSQLGGPLRRGFALVGVAVALAGASQFALA